MRQLIQVDLACREYGGLNRPTYIQSLKRGHVKKKSILPIAGEGKSAPAGMRRKAMPGPFQNQQRRRPPPGHTTTIIHAYNTNK